MILVKSGPERLMADIHDATDGRHGRELPHKQSEGE
jgi:hypothetical protein